MSKDMRREMKNQSQLIKGLVNLLKDDADYICADTDDFDLVALGISINEIKDTIQSIIDNVAELEYSLYLCKQDN